MKIIHNKIKKEFSNSDMREQGWEVKGEWEEVRRGSEKEREMEWRRRGRGWRRRGRGEGEGETGVLVL
jgi:hypothetical protein